MGVAQTPVTGMGSGRDGKTPLVVQLSIIGRPGALVLRSDRGQSTFESTESQGEDDEERKGYIISNANHCRTGPPKNCESVQDIRHSGEEYRVSLIGPLEYSN